MDMAGAGAGTGADDDHVLHFLSERESPLSANSKSLPGSINADLDPDANMDSFTDQHHTLPTAVAPNSNLAHENRAFDFDANETDAGRQNQLRNRKLGRQAEDGDASSSAEQLTSVKLQDDRDNGLAIDEVNKGESGREPEKQRPDDRSTETSRLELSATHSLKNYGSVDRREPEAEANASDEKDGAKAQAAAAPRHTSFKTNSQANSRKQTMLSSSSAGRRSSTSSANASSSSKRAAIIIEVLFRIIFPISLLASTVCRFNAMSFVYCLALLWFPLMPKRDLLVPRSVGMRLLIVTIIFSAACLLAQVGFQLGIHIAYPPGANASSWWAPSTAPFLQPCISSESIIRQLGLVDLLGQPATVIVRYLAPDCLMLTVSIVFLVLFRTFAVRPVDLNTETNQQQQQLLEQQQQESAPSGEPIPDVRTGRVMTASSIAEDDRQPLVGMASATSRRNRLTTESDISMLSSRSVRAQLRAIRRLNRFDFLMVICSAILLAAASIFQPCIITSVFLISFLSVVTYWSLFGCFHVSYHGGRKVILLVAGLFLLSTYVYQFQFAQLLPGLQPDALVPRLVGLVAFVQTSCDMPAQFLFNESVSWTYWISITLVLLLYSFLAIHDRIVADRDIAQILADAQEEQDDAPNDGAENMLMSPLARGRTGAAAAAAGRGTASGDESGFDSDSERPASAARRTRFSRSTSAAAAAAAPTAAPAPPPPAPAPVTEETQGQAASRERKRGQQRISVTRRIGVTVRDTSRSILSFFMRQSFVLSLIVMMAWSVLYFGWLTCGYLLAAYFLWVLPQSRHVTLLISIPFLIYAEALVVLQFIFGFNLNDVEFGSAASINALQLGIVRDTIVADRLSVQSAFVLVFALTVRLYRTERQQRASVSLPNRTPTHEGSPQPQAQPQSQSQTRSQIYEQVQGNDGGDGGDNELVIRRNHMQRELQDVLLEHRYSIRFSGDEIMRFRQVVDPPELRAAARWIMSFFTKYWIYICVALLTFISVQQPVGYCIVYMLLLLYFITTFQISYSFWCMQMKAYWWVMVIYSMVVLLALYINQFDVISNAIIASNDTVLIRALTAVGIQKYATPDLALKLLTPTCFIVLIVLQVHMFHDRFMEMTDMRHKDRSVSAAADDELGQPVTYSPSSGSYGRRQQSSMLRDVIRWMSTLYRRLKDAIDNSFWFVWRMLELHVFKVVAFTVFMVCAYDICAANFVLFASICVSMVAREAYWVLSKFIMLFSGFMVLARMFYQLHIFEASTFYTNCSSNPNASYDNAAWIGLTRNTSNAMPPVFGNLMICCLLTCESLIRYRQTWYRRRHNVPADESEPRYSVAFPNVKRVNADEGLLTCMQFMVNYAMYKFGTELCCIVTVICMACRLDVYACGYGLLMLIPLYVGRRTAARVWPVYMVLLAVLTCFEYCTMVGFAPFMCIQDFLGNMQPELALFLHAPSEAVKKQLRANAPNNLIADFFQLLFVSQQFLAFRVEFQSGSDGSDIMAERAGDNPAHLTAVGRRHERKSKAAIATAEATVEQSTVSQAAESEREPAPEPAASHVAIEITSTSGEREAGAVTTRPREDSKRSLVRVLSFTPAKGTEIHDFISVKLSNLDYVKHFVFLYSYWITIAFVFIPGVTYISLLCMGNLFIAFFLLSGGQHWLCRERDRLLTSWNGILAFSYLVLMLKMLFQLFGCVWLNVITSNDLGCFFVNLFAVRCAWPPSLYSLSNVNPSDSSSTCNSIPPGYTDYLEGHIVWDVLCFVALVLQRRILLSKYFKYVVVVELKVQRKLMARGARYFNEALRYQVEVQRARERSNVEKISDQVKRIRQRQQRRTGAAAVEYKYHIEMVHSGGAYMFEDEDADWPLEESESEEEFDTPLSHPERSLEVEPLPAPVAVSEDDALLDELDGDEPAPSALPTIRVARVSTTARGDIESASTSAGGSPRPFSYTVSAGLTPPVNDGQLERKSSSLANVNAPSPTPLVDESNTKPNPLAILNAAFQGGLRAGVEVATGNRKDYAAKRRTGRESTLQGSSTSLATEPSSSQRRSSRALTDATTIHMDSSAPPHLLSLPEVEPGVETQEQLETVDSKQPAADVIPKSPAERKSAIRPSDFSSSSVHPQVSVEEAPSDVPVGPDYPVDEDIDSEVESIRWTQTKNVFILCWNLFLSFIDWLTLLFYTWSKNHNDVAVQVEHEIRVYKSNWLAHRRGVPLNATSPRSFEASKHGARSIDFESMPETFDAPSSNLLNENRTTLRNIENEMLAFKQSHSRPVRLFICIVDTLMAHWDKLCFAMMVLNHILSANVLSLPYPISVFLYGMLGVPRPTKNYWRVAIYYTMAVIGLKFFCMFPFFSSALNQASNPDSTSDAMWAPAVIGVAQKDDWSVLDMVQLIVLCIHKAMLKRYGLWRDEMDDKETTDMKSDDGAEDSREDRGLRSNSAPDFGDEDSQLVRDTGGDGVSQTLSLKAYVSSFEHFYKQMTSKEFNFVADVYVYMFFLEFVSLLVIAFGYSSFAPGGGSSDDITTFVTKSTIPVPFTLMLLVQFVVILLDRCVFLYRNVKAKFVLHVVVVLVVHIWIFFVLPAMTDLKFSQNVAAIVFYILKCIYFALSAFQIRAGYPHRVLGNFLAKSYTLGNKLAYKGYMYTPFLFEFRIMLDWICIPTSLTFWNWLAIEDVHYTVFCHKVDLVREINDPQLRGETASSGQRFAIIMFFLGLCLLVWVPMFVFSFSASGYQRNEAMQFTIRIAFSGFPPVYESTIFSDSMSFLTLQQFGDFKETCYGTDRASLGQLNNYLRETEVDIQHVTLPPVVHAQWDAAPELVMSDLLRQMRNSSAMGISVSYQILRRMPLSSSSSTKSTGAYTPFVQQTFQRRLSTGERAAIAQAIERCRNSNATTCGSAAILIEPYTVPDMLMPAFVLLSAGSSEPLTVLNAADPKLYPGSCMKLTLNARRSGSGSGDSQSLAFWWRTEAAYSTSFTSSFSSALPRCPGKSHNVTQCWNSNSTDLSPLSPLSFLIFSDRTVPSVIWTLTGGLNLIGLYASVVIIVWKVLRSAIISDVSHNIPYIEMPNVDRILALCRDIYVVRESGQLKVEEELYAQFLYLYRSQEMMIKWSRQPPEGLCRSAAPPPPSPTPMSPTSPTSPVARGPSLRLRRVDSGAKIVS